MTRWIIGVVAAAMATIAVVVVIAAGSDSDTEASAASGPDPEAMAEFRDCMSEHGAELPQPPSDGEPPAPGAGAPPSGGFQAAPSAGGGLFPADAKTRKALQACGDLMPQPPAGAPPGIAPTPQN
jgi:hypothetical protein